MRATLTGFVERGELPGLVTLLARRGEAHVEALGTLSQGGKPMRRDTIFRISSMTKPITAVAAMILVEECRLRLDDPVDSFLPELADRRVVRRLDAPLDDTVPARRPISLRDLLTFRLGFGSMMAPPGSYPIQQAISDLRLGGDGPPQPAHTPDTDEWLRRLGSLPLMYQPGERWLYNTSSDVLGALVARASGQPFEAFLRERIFEPLDMPDTAFRYTGRQAERLASVHARRDGKLEATPRDLSQVVYFSGAGGLSASVEDYLQFAQMLLNGGELNGHRLLGPRTVEMMTANHTGDMVNGQFGRPARGMGFGLGMQVVLDPIAAELAVSKGAISWPGGSGVAHWIEPAEQLVSIFFIQGGQGGPARTAFENAVRQAVID
jgi:CubicO group peptidase (beta-lactamase class C family)